MGSEAFFICFKVLPQHSPGQTEGIHDQGRQPIFGTRFERCNFWIQLKRILLTHSWERFEAGWLIWMKSYKDELRQSNWHVFSFLLYPLLPFIFFILPFFVSFYPLFLIYFPFFLFFVIFLSLLIIDSSHVQFHVFQIFAQRPTEDLHTCMILAHVYCRTRYNEVIEKANPVQMFTLISI